MTLRNTFGTQASLSIFQPVKEDKSAIPDTKRYTVGAGLVLTVEQDTLDTTRFKLSVDGLFRHKYFHIYDPFILPNGYYYINTLAEAYESQIKIASLFKDYVIVKKATEISDGWDVHFDPVPSKRDGNTDFTARVSLKSKNANELFHFLDKIYETCRLEHVFSPDKVSKIKEQITKAQKLSEKEISSPQQSAEAPKGTAYFDTVNPAPSQASPSPSTQGTENVSSIRRRP